MLFILLDIYWYNDMQENLFNHFIDQKYYVLLAIAKMLRYCT